VAESVGDLFVGVPGLRRRHHELHPEKPWGGAEGRGFDSRQLHRWVSARKTAATLFAKTDLAEVSGLDADSLLEQSRTGESRCGSAAFGGPGRPSRESWYGSVTA
jgi:hypothetical protein